MARTETAPTETAEAPEAEPIATPAPFVTDYDANGEPIDAPVDTTPAPALPGFEPENDPNAEFFEGKLVIGHKWSFTGNHEIGNRNAALQAKLAKFKDGQPSLLLVMVEPGDVAFVESTEDGHTKGVFHKRKLHITGVFAADDVATDALFEGGLVRIHRTEVADDIGYLTEEPDDEDQSLEDMLKDALAVEPGMCGKVHRGHLNPCRQPAHACDLPADEAE